MAHLVRGDRVRGVGQQQERVPHKVDAFPGGADAVGAVLQHHRPHRRARQESARFERQQALAIGGGALRRHTDILTHNNVQQLASWGAHVSAKAECACVKVQHAPMANSYCQQYELPLRPLTKH